MVLPIGYRVVYGLADPRTGIVCYIGVSDNPQKRYSEHLRAGSTRQVKVANWVNELRAAKLKPVFIFIDSILAEEALKAEMKWIQHFDKIFPLFNHVKK